MGAEKEELTTYEKALAVNLDPSVYGVFAEIGAGQETANWFFRVSASAGTVAKSISAYDMTMSDVLYGKTKRYVSQERLSSMLAYEYDLLDERLRGKRVLRVRFFHFATPCERGLSGYRGMPRLDGGAFPVKAGDGACGDRIARAFAGRDEYGADGRFGSGGSEFDPRGFLLSG